MTLAGVDVSNWQGDVDWRQVAASGREFAITKATEGTGYVDPTLTPNWRGLRNAGMLRGSYHFARPNRNSAAAEAILFSATMAPLLEPGDVVALDLEENNGSLSQADDVAGWALRWLQLVEQRSGCNPLLYVSPSVISEYGLAARPELGAFGLWLASWGLSHMPAAPAPWDVVALWQSSATGSVPGISGDCDLDTFNGTREQFALYGLPGAVSPPPASTFSVGPGLLQAMQAHGDLPSTDELYFKSSGLDMYSEAFGAPSGARYVWVVSSNQSFRFAPSA